MINILPIPKTSPRKSVMGEITDKIKIGVFAVNPGSETSFQIR